MRMISTISLMLVTLFMVATSVSAHNGWSQTNTPIVEIGQKSYIELLFGNHSGEHTSYRLDRNWGLEDTNVEVTAPSGEEQQITDTFFYMGEEEEIEERIGVNNYHVGSLLTEEEGIYTIAAKGDFTYGDETEPTLRSAKSYVAASKCPSLESVKDFKGYDKHVTLDRAEIVPLFNPTAIAPDNTVSAQVMLKGEPVPNADVAVIKRSDSSEVRVNTDEEGLFSWEVGESDYYLIRVELEDSDAKYEATMTYIVSERLSL
ncbi:DUF4198 domain-containing protein [Salipaludibacillus sp. CF4.18]|uniref:DUF4198 domain-containing protein n=1 Tax=Salipaludibacillus sp. CF4.18 TaxID=3373081 RepID=UPI003EE47079